MRTTKHLRASASLLALVFAATTSLPATSTAAVSAPRFVRSTRPSSTTTTASTSTALSPAWYVSPNGADTNNGLSATAPFKTLEKAQAAMQASTTKTTYLLGGIYLRAAPVILRAADAGESWLAYPGQTPVLDGGGSTAEGFYIHANNATVRWLTLQNFATSGILVQIVSGVTIDSNTIQNIHATAWNQAGIQTMNSFVNGKITHNIVQNVQGDGIDVATAAGDNISNLLIDSNWVHTTCTVVADCGGIHANDRAQSNTNIVLSNNIVSNYGKLTAESAGIYLDDFLSNALIKNNIVYGSGQYTFLTHGGSNNTVVNNIFDVSTNYAVGLYQSEGSSPMTQNVISCNISYSSGSPPISVWRDSGTGTAPSDYKNIYWDTKGSMPNIGAIVDTNPLNTNPYFVNPSAGNYVVQSAAPTSFCGFQNINTSQVGPLPNT